MKKRSRIYLPLLAAVILLGQYFVFRIREKQNLDRLQSEELMIVSLASTEITDWLSQALQELRYLSSKDNVVSYVGEPNNQTQSNVANGFLQFSDSIAIYDQIRILDLDGMEKVRVDYEDNVSVIISQEELKNKNDRYYFIECRELSVGEYYISPLDLNLENGEIEKPLKPIIRICTPITDRDGNKKGVLILNYLAAIELEKLSAINENLMLINNEGYWLYSPNPDDEWGFMFEQEENFNTRYPVEWQSILTEKNGHFETENGLWTFTTVNPLWDALEQNPHLFAGKNGSEVLYSEGNYSWKIISYVSPDEVDSLRKEIAYPIMLSSIILFPLAYYGIWNLNRRIEVEEQADEDIRFIATHDMMTGLFNRAFFEAELSRLASGRQYPVSMFVLDADNLKRTNDTLGHLAGDKVIMAIANVLKKSFRTEDIVTRFGGDEFAILLPETDRTTCMEIFKRIQNNITNHNSGNPKIGIDVSIGTATSKKNEELVDVLKRADERMYKMKANKKTNKVS